MVQLERMTEQNTSSVDVSVVQWDVTGTTNMSSDVPISRQQQPAFFTDAPIEYVP
jgi:hypothetical protein